MYSTLLRRAMDCCHFYLDYSPFSALNFRILALETKIASAMQQNPSARGLSAGPDACKDLECIICKDLPEKKPGASLYVYSCAQAHLLCQECLSRIQKCPLCQQNFVLNKPQRNYLAERLLDQLFTSVKPQDDRHPVAGKYLCQLVIYN